MKAILNYGYYLNQGKQYQIKFIYENEYETKVIESFMKSFEKNTEVIPYNSTYSKRRNLKPIKVIGGTNIPKDMLLQFISQLIMVCGAKIVIRNKEFTSFDLTNIVNAIDKLHINATLNKGSYFGIDDTYYVTFEYASIEQQEELSYDFFCELNSIIGKNIDLGTNSIYPISINGNGKRTTANNGIIHGTNIPEEYLPFFIKRFIEKHNMVINVGNVKIKDKFDTYSFLSTLPILEKEKGRSRQRERQSAK